MQQETRVAPAVESRATVVMKDHAFDRDLDDLGMSPEDLELEIDTETEAPAAPAHQEIMVVPR